MTKPSGRVFCIGETVLDIMFQGDQPIAARPGGSMLNSAVSLGRAGIPVCLISDFARDHAGDMIHGFLSRNGISTEYISRYDGGKTSLSLAFLDQKQNAAYSFYKIYPENRITKSLPSLHSGDILLFGSFYALTRSLRKNIIDFVQSSKSNGVFIIYDPNFRSAHLCELDSLKPWILENISMANLVRGSEEDFKYIFDATDANEAFLHVKSAGCPILIYTRSTLGVDVLETGKHRTFEVSPVSTVSTIGAGDAFNAGLIYAMMREDSPSGCLTESTWDRMIGYAIRFSADVCQSLDNYISDEFANKLKTNDIAY